MQRGVAIYALGEKLSPEIAMLIMTEFYENSIYEVSLLYEVPGGNLVGGLPPAASTGEEA